MQPDRPLLIQLYQISQARHKHQYIPYSAGLLQAYVQGQPEAWRRYTFLALHIDRLPVVETLKQTQIADVFGFSAYVWNIEYSLALAKAIKAIKPEALTVFGGPQVPDRAEDFLRANPQVDVCVHGEGEITFYQLLESLPDKNWEQIKGISWLDAQGQFHTHQRPSRIKDLDIIPSPYLQGVFSPLLQKFPDYQWVALWETTRGCPFTCTYCDWGSAVQAKVQRFGMERLEAEMDWFGRSKINIINCCDANFGILPRDLEITDYMIATRARYGNPHLFFVQGAKNVTERIYLIQKKIIDANMSDMVTLALQSVTPEALKAIRRENISLDTYRTLQQRFQKEGVAAYSDMLMGLPGETYDSFADGLMKVIDEGQHHLIQLFNVYILPNAEFNQPEYRKAHGIETVRIPYSEPNLSLNNMEVQEWQELVIGTRTLSREQWRKTRVLAWWVEVLYLYRKLMQLPIFMVRFLAQVPFRTIFEFYMQGELQHAPILTQLQSFFNNKAAALEKGDNEYCIYTQGEDSNWLPVKDFIIAGLYNPEIMKAFYQENLAVLKQLLISQQAHLPEGLIEQAVQLSQALFQSFVSQEGFAMNCSYNLWEVYQAILKGEECPLEAGLYRYVHDWSGPPFHQVRAEVHPQALARETVPCRLKDAFYANSSD